MKDEKNDISKEGVLLVSYNLTKDDNDLCIVGYHSDGVVPKIVNAFMGQDARNVVDMLLRQTKNEKKRK